MLTNLSLIFCFLASFYVGTPRGEAVRWRSGRTRFGRLVVTTKKTWDDGCPMYMPVFGKPPAHAHRHLSVKGQVIL